MTAADGSRAAGHAAVSAALARLDDGELLGLVESAQAQTQTAGAGIGGRTALLEVAGRPVFVKRVPLTDLERQPANRHSTANLFALPPFVQYGIGSPGFGVWRELAAHLLTTEWVLDGRYGGFPLLHHWRVLPEPEPVALPDELADVTGAVAYWDGSEEVGDRLRALAGARASVTLFLEYLPYSLRGWLDARIAAGPAAADQAIRLAERELAAGTEFMNRNGLLHFDAHPDNVLTDGTRLYFADFGLAASTRFDLAADERAFLELNATYDRTYTATQLVNLVTTALTGLRGDRRDAFVRAWADGERPSGLPQAAADVLDRHAPVAAVMIPFYRDLQQRSRTTPYPAHHATRALAAADRDQENRTRTAG